MLAWAWQHLSYVDNAPALVTSFGINTRVPLVMSFGLVTLAWPKATCVEQHQNVCPIPRRQGGSSVSTYWSVKYFVIDYLLFISFLSPINWTAIRILELPKLEKVCLVYFSCFYEDRV